MFRIAYSLFAMVSFAAILMAQVTPAAQAKSAGAQAKPSTPATAKAAPAAKSASATIVNINTASVADFESLPGIGAKTAARIVEYRQKNGPFKKVEELMNIRGLGEKNFLKLKAQLTVGSPKADRPDR